MDSRYRPRPDNRPMTRLSVNENQENNFGFMKCTLHFIMVDRSGMRDNDHLNLFSTARILTYLLTLILIMFLATKNLTFRIMEFHIAFGIFSCQEDKNL